MAQWNRISQDFEQKWVFSQYTDLVDIKFEPFESQAGDITFATVMIDQDDAATLTLNTWNASKLSLTTDSQIIPGTVSRDAINNISKLSIFESSERFHLIVNDAGGKTSTDMFVLIGKGDDDEPKIDSIYSDVLTASTTSIAEAPTERHRQGYGYD